MKKRILALLLCVSTVISMTGCGSKGESAEATEAVENTESTEEAPAVPLAKYDLEGSDYVTLCDYSTIEVTISGDYEVTDQDVLDYVEKIFTQGGPFYTADPDKTTVEEGDIVNVDYVGKLDGEAFQGGTAENQNIDVSNNSSASGTSYIDGFTDGLLGASVGDVIDSNVTFPEDYNNEDLAGKEVVFTFTVNSIQKEVTMDTMDDEFASEQFGVDSVDGVYEQVRQYLESSAESTHKNDIYSALEDYLLENCTVDMPADYRSDVIEAIRANFIDRYCSGDESQMETVLSSYGYTEESIEQEWSDSVESSIKLELIVKAIAEKEDIQIDDTEFEDYVSTIVSNGGYGDADTLYSNYGYGDSVYGKNQIRVIYLAGLVLDKLAETAEVTENAVEETTESVESTESVDRTEKTENESPSDETLQKSEQVSTPTTGEKNALAKAKKYLQTTSFSYNGLVKQLEYEKYSHEEAVYAADNCGADWNEQADEKAKDYLKTDSFSKDSLIEQLEYEGFTHEQAVYGAESNGY